VPSPLLPLEDSLGHSELPFPVLNQRRSPIFVLARLPSRHFQVRRPDPVPLVPHDSYKDSDTFPMDRELLSYGERAACTAVIMLPFLCARLLPPSYTRVLLHASKQFPVVPSVRLIEATFPMVYLSPFVDSSIPFMTWTAPSLCTQTSLHKVPRPSLAAPQFLTIQ